MRFPDKSRSKSKGEDTGGVKQNTVVGFDVSSVGGTEDRKGPETGTR